MDSKKLNCKVRRLSIRISEKSWPMMKAKTIVYGRSVDIVSVALALVEFESAPVEFGSSGVSGSFGSVSIGCVSSGGVSG